MVNPPALVRLPLGLLSCLLLSITLFSTLATTTRPARLNILKRKNPSYHALAPPSLAALPKLTSFSIINYDDPTSFLARLLIPRAVGSSNLTYLQTSIDAHFTRLGWHADHDTFDSPTPYGPKTFKNLVFTHDPLAARRLVFAAHLDSKFFETHPEDQFVGATDSAAPVAMLLDLAEALTEWLDKRKERVEKEGGEEGTMGQGETLQIVLFDGEEAFKEWTDEDSIYGARHLASLWSQPTLPPTASRPTPVTPLSRISHLILLDLLGSEGPTIQSFYPSTGWLFDEFSHSESLLASNGDLWPETIQTQSDYDQVKGDRNRKERKFFAERVRGAGFTGGGISDDHLPFLARGVPILHFIAAPFPRVWHTLQDDASALDYDTIRAWCLILRLTVAEYLGLDPLLGALDDPPESKRRDESSTTFRDELKSEECTAP